MLLNYFRKMFKNLNEGQIKKPRNLEIILKMS